MAGLSQNDVRLRERALSEWRGARLQSAAVYRNVIQLELFLAGRSLYLIVDMTPASPNLVGLGEPLIKKGELKPIVLFLKSNFVGKRLVGVLAETDFGRVLRLHFGEGFEMEIRLFPHGQNLLLTTGDKRLSLNRPKPLEAVESKADAGIQGEFDLLKAGEEWLRKARGTRQASTRQQQDSADRRQDPKIRLRKLDTAREKILSELEKKRGNRWLEAGDWLKSHQTLDVPADFARLVDRSKPLSWNIENCYVRHKENLRKIAGTEERLREIDRQIFGIESGDSPEPLRSAPAIEEGIKARRKVIEEDVAVVVGRSAAENLKLLRSSRPWYLWLHLRDEPGAHAIVMFNKGRVISDAVLRKAANFLVQVQYGARAKALAGDQFDAITTECRFVRPIKGDRLGRVNYSDARTLRFRLDLD